MWLLRLILVMEQDIAANMKSHFLCFLDMFLYTLFACFAKCDIKRNGLQFHFVRVLPVYV